MSNRPRQRPRTIAHDLADLAGIRIPGGCDDCNAYQVMVEHAPNVLVVRVFHDDTCPFFSGSVR